MSDHGHHDPGGHELEAINTKLLFRLLFSLTFITFLACIAVVQWFNSQRRELQNSNASEGSFMLQDHDKQVAEALGNIDRVAADVVANPALLAAPPAPANWQHPDDLAGGPKPAPAPEQKPIEKPAPEEQPVPVELPKEEPAKEEPSKQEPAKEEPSKQEPAKQDKPEDGE